MEYFKKISQMAFKKIRPTGFYTDQPETFLLVNTVLNKYIKFVIYVLL